MVSTKNKYTIPDFICEFYQKTLTKSGTSNILKYKQNITPEIEQWFEAAPYSKKVIFSLLKKGVKQYSIERCVVCGKELNESQVIRGAKTCSHKCAASLPEFKEKIKNTNFKKYGTLYPCQNKQVNTKRENTNLEKYGVMNPCENKEVNDKRIKTNVEKYGFENPSESEVCKEKIIATSMERYGVPNPSLSEEVKNHFKEKYGNEYAIASKSCREKSTTTMLNRYGVRNARQSEIFNEKIKKTNLERYGIETALSAESVRQKIKNTMLERYGVENPNQISIFKNKSYKTHKRSYFQTFVELLNRKNISLDMDLESFVEKGTYNFHCLRCNTAFVDDKSSPQKIWCPECTSRQGTSNKELDFFKFVKSLYTGVVKEHDRTILNGKEIDIYIPEKKLAFEFDGNFWHSEVRKNKFAHQEKTFKCREKGIRLIHIFEYEWDNERIKIENLVKSALGIFEKVIYARECTCREISSNEYNLFLDLNHLQGRVNSSIRYGLFFNNELVSVIGFGKSRFQKDEFELYRYCVKAGHRVIGGFSKLIKHSNVYEFVSYVDLTHFSGEGYLKLGFKEIEVTPPNYVYVKGSRFIRRISAQKHKLKHLLGESFDETLSESDNMLNNNWLRIYDSGNLKLKFSKFQQT